MTIRIGSGMRNLFERDRHGQRGPGPSARLNIDTPAQNPRSLPDARQAGAVHRLGSGTGYIRAETSAVVVDGDVDRSRPPGQDHASSRRTRVLDNVADGFLDDPE